VYIRGTEEKEKRREQKKKNIPGSDAIKFQS
jgi:hypothetical protein